MKIPFLPKGATLHTCGNAMLLVEAVVACNLVELCGDLARAAVLHTRCNALLLVDTNVSR